MTEFTVGIIFGLTFGLLLMGVLSLGSYDRGVEAATRRRATWLGDALRRRMGSQVVTARRVA